MLDVSENANDAQESGYLSDLLKISSSHELPIITHIASNMGNSTFLFTLKMKEFFSQSAVANERGKKGEAVAQRQLNLQHATNLAKYMLKGLVKASQQKRTATGVGSLKSFDNILALLGNQPYVSMQPIVCNLRDVNPDLKNLRASIIKYKDTGETAGYKVFLPTHYLLYVIDGQHRRKAMQILFDFLNNSIATRSLGVKGNLLSPFRGEINDEMIVAFQEILNATGSSATVQIECHLGLDVDQERQLFHDLNNLGKKVESSLALEFDNSNPVNVFIKETLIDDDSIFTWEVIEKDSTNWNEDRGEITRKDLVGICARLFLNKTNIRGATANNVEPKVNIVHRFWSEVMKIEGLGKPGAKLCSVAAQPVVLKALAKLTHDFAFNKKTQNTMHLEKFLNSICEIDFSHKNPMWRYYQLSPEEVERYGLASLKNHLPDESKTLNRDIGMFDKSSKLMRFGSKHNDITPILGDMIRWTLGLPSRH